MAVIGKIRQRSGLLIFLIGLSIVGFLIMDATNSQGSLLKGRKDSVGIVNGEKISYNDFTKKYEENIKNAEEQMRGQSMGDDQRNYMRTQTWNEMVSDIIFSKIYKSLGIGVTPDEMHELAMGENASPYIRQDQQFRNPQTGQFDPAQVTLYLQRLDQDPQGVEPGTVRRQWLKFESLLKKNQYQIKYDNLINKGLYTPTWIGEAAYTDQTRTVDFKYVQLPYTEVKDNEVKVTDADIEDYLKKHSAAFSQDEETRKLDYVIFDISASPSDYISIREFLEGKREEFAKGQQASDDSLFLKINSETPFDGAYYDKDKIFSSVKDSFFTLPVKSIVGPYVDANFYKLAKISDRKMISDSLHLRDIKISFEGVTSQEAANTKFKLVDSIFKLIDTLKTDFGVVASQLSDDMMSKMRGGDIGWVKLGEKDKAFNDLIFYHAQKGKLYRIPVQSENAIHIVQIVEDRPSKMAVQVSYLSKEILPSSETEKNIYGVATAFAADNQSPAKFQEAAKKLNVKTVASLQKDAFTVEGLGSAREVVKWAFQANKETVSPVFTIGKKHVVALLEDIIPKGLPPVSAIKEKIQPLVLKEKRFEFFSKRIEDAKAGTIENLALKFNKSAEQTDKATFTNASLNGGAYEPVVVASAISTETKKLSHPIKGNVGTYIVQPIAVAEPAKISDFVNYLIPAKQQLQGKARNAQEVEKKLAKIEDNRFDFF